MREQANNVDDALDKLTNTTHRNAGDFVGSSVVGHVLGSFWVVLRLFWGCSGVVLGCFRVVLGLF